MSRHRSESPSRAPGGRSSSSRRSAGVPVSCGSANAAGRHVDGAPPPLPRGDAAAGEEPHGFALGTVNCPRPARARVQGQTPLATLAGWFAVEEAPLVKGSRVPRGYELERRAGVGTVVVYEPAGILVWAEVVSLGDADVTEGSIMFFYLPVAHLRDVATDPLSYDSSILSWPDPKDEPAVFASRDAGLAGLGCLAVRMPVDSPPQPADRAVRFDCPAGRERPRAMLAKTPKPESTCTASAKAGPFTRRLVDTGVAVTRWNPQQRVWLAPRGDSDDD